MSSSRFPVGRLGILVGGQGTAAVLGFVNISLAAHALPAAAFGFLVTGLGLAQGLRLACATQSWQAMIRHGRGDTLRLAGTLACFEHGLGLAAAGFYLLILHTGGRPLGLDQTAIEALSWLALGMAGNAADAWLGVLHARGRQGTAALLQGGSAVIRCAGILLAVASGAGIGGFAAAHLCADIGTTLLAAATAGRVLGVGPLRLLRTLIHPLSPVRLAQRHPGLGRLLATGSATSALGALAAHLDVPVVALVLGPEDAGRYRLVRALAALALVLTIPVRQVCQAHWSGAGTRDLRRDLVRTWLIGLPCAAAALALLVPWLDRLMPLLFGAHAQGLGAPAGIMLGAAALAVLAAPAQAVLVARHGEVWCGIAQAALVAVHLGLLPILATIGGLPIAAWSLACATSAALIMLGLAAWKHAGGRLGN